MSDTGRWQRIKELFRLAQLQTDDARDAWLAGQCGDDESLLREVRALLAAQRGSQGILDHGAAGALRRMGSDDAVGVRVGERIGAYRLLRLIGEGGMGRVYLAERDAGDFVQCVALKLVRAEFGGAETRARFLRERNVLARLVHPHIAQLHDGGVAADGTPFFTLEYVEGEPITKYCDAHVLGIRARVLLALQVCAAVAYAHRNLIVHRDLKPSNIFVTADGSVKLLDFGIAKLIDPDAADDQTGTQARLMTPEYAAPEQVLGEPITTATDVYAIGVLLYELLSGRMPYARADAGTISIQKAVVEEVPEPLHRAVNRMTTRGDSTTGDAAAAARGIALPNLRRVLRGDLDRILQRALAKAPEARYATVGALAADLNAYLEGHAISGGTRTYQMRKFVRRHWPPLAAAAVILLVLTASGTAIVWQSQQTLREAQNTRQVKDFLLGLFTAVDPREAKGRVVSARELLDRGAQSIATNQSLDTEQKAEIESTLGRIYYQLGLFDPASKLQDDALKLFAARNERSLRYAQTESERADTAAELGDLKAAATWASDAQQKIDTLPETTPADRARALHVQARVALDQRDFATAKRYADAELALVRAEKADSRVLYQALLTDAGASWGLENWAAAENQYREALAVAERQSQPDELDISKAQTNIAMTLQSQSRYLEAAALEQQALATEEKSLGADHPSTMALRRDLALAEWHLGRYARARQLLEQVLAAQRAKLGEGHPAIAGTEINLGGLLTDSGDADTAEKLLTEAVAIFEKKYGHDFQGVQMALGNLAAAHTAQHKLDLAAQELTEVAALEKKRGQTDKDSVMTLCRRADVARLRGDSDGALDLAQRAVIGAGEKYSGNDRYTALAHDSLALALRERGDAAGAIRELRAALASYAGYIPQAAHPLAATVRYNLAMLLLKRAETRAEGLQLLREATDLREKFLGADDPQTQQARETLRKAQAAAKP